MSRIRSTKSCLTNEITASNAVGKRILKSAAESINRVTLESGGESPNIFFADADFETARGGALFGIFINPSQSTKELASHFPHSLGLGLRENHYHVWLPMSEARR